AVGCRTGRPGPGVLAVPVAALPPVLPAGRFAARRVRPDRRGEGGRRQGHGSAVVAANAHRRPAPLVRSALPYRSQTRSPVRPGVIAMFRRLATYTATLLAVLTWFSLARLAVIIDPEIRQAWVDGERFDRLDDAIDRLDALHTELFGADGE